MTQTFRQARSVFLVTVQPERAGELVALGGTVAEVVEGDPQPPRRFRVLEQVPDLIRDIMGRRRRGAEVGSG